MSRKEASFGQLIEYMLDDKKRVDKYNIYQNVFGRELNDMEAEFLENSSFIQKRKNGNFFYHEILSITRTSKISEDEQKTILQKLGYKYISHRAKNNLVLGILHDDGGNNLHYHLLISSNAIQESKRTRLSKNDFRTLKNKFENYVLKKYPQLEQSLAIQKKAGEKLSKKASELKRRTGKTPQREQAKEKIRTLLNESTNKKDFLSRLHKTGLEMYTRGRNTGILNTQTGNKYRLSTLGLMPEYDSLTNRTTAESKQEQAHTVSPCKETRPQKHEQTDKAYNNASIKAETPLPTPECKEERAIKTLQTQRQARENNSKTNTKK